MAPPESEIGRETVVILKDGRRFSGELVARSADRVTLRIAGIDTPFAMTIVERVDVLPPVLERYRIMRAAIDDTDAERRVLLVEWLRARQQWDLAVAELDDILAQHPDNADARKLKLLIEAQRALGKRPAPQNVLPGARIPGPIPDFPLLPDHDINLIKVYEVDLTDPPRMVIDRATVTRLLDEHIADERVPRTPAEREALYRASPARVLDLMFKVQARDLYGHVRVLDQPRPMRLFRDNVHRTLVANYCATTRCHGGEEAGRLKLAAVRPNSEPTVYTNFLILERYRLPDGSAMIDYDNPAKSILLQFALPREAAEVDHPIVPGHAGRGDLWRPFFRSTDDGRYKDAVEWMRSMYRPRPQYPIDFRGPGQEPVVPKPGEPPVER
ncbi:MAG: hypothetical protein WD749_05675 [Phycisphaerales bacterium]